MCTPLIHAGVNSQTKAVRQSSCYTFCTRSMIDFVIDIPRFVWISIDLSLNRLPSVPQGHR